MTQRTLTLTGTLDVPALSPTAAEPEIEPESLTEQLITEVCEVRAARGDMDRVMELFRQTPLWVETEHTEQGESALRTVNREGLHWLPVFTALEQLARFAQATGRGGAEIQYGELSGAELIDEALPALPHGTGLVLDPVAEHVFALPPVSGIVPAELAVGGGGMAEHDHLHRLQMAGAQMRLLAPAMTVQAEQVPASILGNAEVADKMRQVLAAFAGSAEHLADEVDDLAAWLRRLEQEQCEEGRSGGA